jgi:Tol biopolymer transport system component
MSTEHNAHSATPQPGATFSHYVVQERLGGGGMGTVYRARDARLGRDVAIKVINADIAGDAQRIARFHREARAVGALNHPGIVTIHDTGHEHGTPYIVTELVDGTTVRTLLERDHALTPRQVIEIGSQVADALGAAHGAGITHRDVKPENIMITRTGRVKLLDFGLAQAPANDADDDETKTGLVTAAGIVLGTPAYMSPEQVRGEALDARSDNFSLGVVLYEMASGGRPFTGATPADIVSAVLRAEPPPLSESSPGLRLITERCLQKRRDDRFQSAADLAFALTSLAPPSSVMRQAVTEERSSRPRVWRMAATAAAIGVMAILAVVVYRGALGRDPAALGRVRPFATEAYGESQPVWSPDGRSIAYVAAMDDHQAIVVKSLTSPSPAPVARCPALCDPIAWSSDGSRIFYQSRTSHLNARLWSVARTGGEPASLFQDDVRMLASGFSPDGKRLALLRVINLPNDGGVRYGLFLSEPPGAEPVRFEAFPLKHLVTPTRVAWAVDSNELMIFSSNPAQIHVVRLSDGTIRQMPMDTRTDMSLSSDGRFAVVAQPTFTATRTGLQWLDTNSGQLAPLLSSENILSFPKVAPDGSRVAYVASEVDYDLVEIPLDGSPIRPLLASRLVEHSIHASPRADEFTYVAASEAPEIRVRQRTTLAERVVVSRADFSAEPAMSRFASVAFSPDGSRLAYNRNFEIWISPANGGTPAKLTRDNGEFAPEWSPDGAWMAFNYAKPKWGGLVKVRVGADSDPVRLRQGMCGIVAPAWSPDGAWIACGREPRGLELVPAAGGAPRALGAEYEPLAVWSRDSTRLYVIRAADGRRELGELTWRTGSFRRVATIPEGFTIQNPMSWSGRLSLSHDGTAIVTAVLRETGDIWILDGLRPPRRWWQRLVGD